MKVTAASCLTRKGLCGCYVCGQVFSATGHVQTANNPPRGRERGEGEGEGRGGREREEEPLIQFTVYLWFDHNVYTLCC